MSTPRFAFVEWQEGSTQPQTLHNTLALNADTFMHGKLVSRTTDAQPASPAPAEGDAYVMTASATGTDWAGFTENYVAVYYDSAWTEYAPPVGLVMYCADEGIAVFYNGSAWIGAWVPLLHNLSAATAPTSTDDADAGYSVGSVWIDTSSSPRAAWLCIDATASAASWKPLI